MSDIDDMRFDLYCEIEELEKENQQLKAMLEKAESKLRDAKYHLESLLEVLNIDLE